MYTAFFGLRCLPFEDRADVRFFFPAAEHEEAIAAMQYEVQHGSGVGLILGEPGTGKTIVIRALLQRLTQNEKVVVVTVPGSGATDLLRETCKGFGVSLSSSVEDARGMARLRRHFSRSVRDGYRPVLIIDQAEHMSPADLVDVESLLDLQDERGRLVRIVLVANPRFKALLEQPVFTRLRQLAFTEHGLSPLCREETAQYIRHRLKVAGAPMEELFSDEAMEEAYAQSLGVPRVINQVCNAAMLAAFGSGAARIEGRNLGAAEPVASPEIVEAPSTASFGRLAAAVCSNSLGETEWEVSEEPSEREFDATAASISAVQLETLIQRAQGVAENLQRRLPRTMDAMEATQQRVTQLLADARQQIHSLESRLAHETARADQAALRLERAEQVAARAEQLEARLSAFAEQLSSQMDQVQSRVAEMMKFASPLDDARNRLEGAIRQADSTRSKIDESVERGMARMTRQMEDSKIAAETTASEILESAGQRARQLAEQVKTESSTVTEKAERALKAAAADGAKRIAQAVAAAQTQAEATLQSVAGQVAMCDQKINHLRDAAEAGERTVQASIVKAVRQGDELKQSGEQLRQALQSAREAGEELRTLQAESSKSAARIETDATEARQICEHMSAMTAAADQKIGQLASVQAALSHLHERIGKLLTQAHPAVERGDQTIQRLSEAVSLGEKIRSRINDEGAGVVAEVEAQLERIQAAGLVAERETKSLGTASECAGQVLRQLTATREQVVTGQSTLRNLLNEATSWTGRMESFQSVVVMGDKTAEKLAEIVSAGSSLAAELPQLLEETQNQHNELEAAIQSLESLFRTREQAERSARHAAEEANSFLTAFQTEVAAGDRKLEDFAARTSKIESQLEQVSLQADGAREVSVRLQSAVDEAHAQSENLERVCVAVRKVFAGLSQASLSARKNAQEVEEFLATANETAASLKSWLTRVRVQIEGAITGGHSSNYLPLGHRASSHMGSVAQAAELSLEGEPGAEKAHLVAGGLERKNAPAREISELIEKARQAKEPNYNADLVVGDAH